jgi:DNA (cytosine-5)-methyltransferase 1
VPFAIDLFCGAGGMSEGITQAGFHILFSSDISQDVELTYTNRHCQIGLIQGYNTYFCRDDIRNLTGNRIMNLIMELDIFKYKKGSSFLDIDAVFGGPPCQGFSRAGKRDKNDPRNMLFKEYLRVINEIKPKYVVMENVEGFLDTSFDKFIGINGNLYIDTLVPDILTKELTHIGYEALEPKVLNASEFGVPQKRKRVIFLAARKGQPLPKYPSTNSPKTYLSAKNAIGDLITDHKLRETVNKEFSEYQLNSREGRTLKIDGTSVNYDGKIYNHDITNHLPEVKERFSLYKQGENTKELSDRILKNGIELENKDNLVQYISEKTGYKKQEIIDNFLVPNSNSGNIDLLLTKKSIRARLDPNCLAPTIMTLPDDFISPYEDRVLTVREMARLQSFDDSFIFYGKKSTGGMRRKLDVPQYTQVGNAVPPLLARAIAEEIIKVLKHQ